MTSCSDPAGDRKEETKSGLEEVMMRIDIIEFLQKEIYERCKRPENHFGMGCYDHIEAVVKNAAWLAEKMGADQEIAVIAAWLHDIASITDYSLYEMHHLYGADIAGQLLRQWNYEESRIAAVQSCIRNHRGSVANCKTTKEEICVADADAISHFDNVPSLLYLAFVRKKMGYEEGKAFVIGKLDRSYAKLSRESQAYYNGKYQKVMEVLGADTIPEQGEPG